MANYRDLFPKKHVRQVVSAPAAGTSPRFLAVGDSILKSLQPLPNTDLVSIPGANIRKLHRFLKSVMLRYEVIYVHVGTNCVDCSSFIEDYNRMLDMLQERSVLVNTVVIIGSILPRWSLTTERMLSAQIYRQRNSELEHLARSRANVVFF